MTTSPSVASLLPAALPVGMLVVKATLLLGVAAVSARALRGASAAARHLAWTLGIAGVLVLPIASAVLPAWSIVVPIAQDDPVEPQWERTMPADVSIVMPARTPDDRPVTATRMSQESSRPSRLPLVAAIVLAFAWAAGSVVSLLRLLVATRRARALVGGGRAIQVPGFDDLARSLGIARAVRLVETEGVSVPMTFGARRPSILVPEGFAGWDEGRRSAVILHELAHVQRRDWLVQCLAQLASVLLWFHPLVRLAERCIRQEAEQAADDLVLAQGTRPSSYAAHLVGLVQSLQSPGSNSMTVSMIGGPFDGRIRAILDHARQRGPAPARVRVMVAAAALATFATCAALDVSAEPMRRSAWKDTRDQLADAVGLGPSDAGGWYRRGMDLHGDGEYARAIEAFRKCLAADPTMDAAMYDIACGHARLGHVDDAFAWLDKAEKAGFELDMYLSSDGDLATLRHDPRWTSLLARIGESDDTKDSRERLASLRSARSSDAGEWASVGTKLLGSGDYDGAVQALSRTLELDPDSPNVAYNLACAQSLAGHRVEALDALEKAVEAGYGDAHHAERDSNLDAIRDDARFAAILRGMETLKLPSFDGFMGVETSAASWEKAADGYRAWIQDHPQSGRAWFNLGFAALRTGQPKAGAAAFHRAYNLGHRRGVSAYDVACAHAQAGSKDEAFQWLARSQQAGFDVASRAADDDDLESLRGDARFAKYRHAGSEGQFWIF